MNFVELVHNKAERQPNYTITNEDLEIFLSQMVEDKIKSRFGNSTVTRDEVLKIWDISDKTLTNYVNNEIITPVNPFTKPYRFLLTDVILKSPKYQRK